MSVQKLFTIAADAPFLETLADRVLDGTLLGGWPREGVFWLTDVTIVLPTRRARLALAQAFLDRNQMLLPDIRTFGGEPADEEPFLSPHEAPPPPPPVSQLERRLALARLIDAWARTPGGREVLATPPNAAEIFGLADSLGEIVDDLTIEGGDLGRLTKDVSQPELAANWQKTLQFLQIALDYWPRELAGGGKGDAAALRNERLRRQAEAAPLIFTDRPVIAAGSTGSIPATAELLAALAKLPRGVIVLPGLDNTLSPAAHEGLLNESLTPHGHPQYGLAKLLRRLGSTPTAVTELAPGPRAARTLVLREALALAEATAGWVEARRRLGSLVPAAAEGLAVIAAHTADDEARAIALAARDALWRKRTVGIVSPDQNLTRRITVELQRFGVEVDDPAGTPLFHSPAGRLARLILALAVNDFAPIDLMALLRNRATKLGLPRTDLARLADRIELCLLRGQRLRPGVAGLRTALDRHAEVTGRRSSRLTPHERDAVANLFSQIEAALAPLTLLLKAGSLTPAAFAKSLHDAFADVTAARDGEQTEPLPGARELTAWAAEVAARPENGPAFPPIGLDNVLFALMNGFDVRSVERRRDDISIWGQLEARLQHRDLMIVAGLNEDVWPRPADPGPWLSRGMRLAAGLEPPERRQGQASHDFAMALGNGEAIIAHAERLGTSPALPSRFVQRLDAFLGEETARMLRRRGAHWLDQARLLDAVPDAPQGATRPMPRPAAQLRPRQLSVTEVETLFRSPYDLYAKHVLRLRKLAPLGEEPDARDRGSMVHAVFARFVELRLDADAPGAQQRLEALAAEAFEGLDAIGERRDIWLKRFSLAAKQFLEFERGRNALVRSRHAEIAGRWTLPELGGFVLTGRADRIDQLADGTLEILDFKTGAIPTPGQMRSFEAPQLLLEAAMARAGAFDRLGPKDVSGLSYVKIGLGPEAFTVMPFKPRDDDLAAAADEVSRRLQGHVDALLLRDALPLAARIRPAPGQRYRGDYDHLARTDEWTLLAGDDSE